MSNSLSPQSSAPVFQKLFQFQAEKYQKKLVQVTRGGFSNGIFLCLKEKDFTKGPKMDNVTRVPIPLNKIGQVVGHGIGGPEMCRVLINQDIFHISAAYLRLIKKEDIDDFGNNGSNS